MRLSFDDEESFKEAIGSLKFNNTPTSSDPDSDSLQRVGSSSSMPPGSQERNEDICFNNPPSDPNIILEVPSRRVPVGSSSSTGNMLPQERSEDTWRYYNSYNYNDTVRRPDLLRAVDHFQAWVDPAVRHFLWYRLSFLRQSCLTSLEISPIFACGKGFIFTVCFNQVLLISWVFALIRILRMDTKMSWKWVDQTMQNEPPVCLQESELEA